MIESMCGGEFLCKNVNEAWDFLENLSDKTYEWETIREAHSSASKIFMNKGGNSSNGFVASKDTRLSCEHQLNIPLFHSPQPHDYISSSCSYDLISNYGLSSHSNLFIDVSKKLEVKGSRDLKHDMIVVSNNILVEDGDSLEGTPLEEPFYKEVVDVMPRDMKCVDLTSIECPPRPTPTPIVMPSKLLFHFFMGRSMSVLLELETCMINAPNLDQTY